MGLPTRRSSSASRSTTCRAATRSATRGWRPRAASRPSTRTRSRPGLDLCLVHNGSLSNHNRAAARAAPRGHRVPDRQRHRGRRRLPDLAAARGATLEQALEGCLDDLDGFYTFAVGTADGFAVLRDPIACKPAVMAETDDWVAMASEYRAIAVLPGRRGRARCGSPRRPRSTLGAGAGLMATGDRRRPIETVDLAERRAAASSTRACTRSPADDRAARAGGCSTRAARTPSRSGLDAAVEVEIDGHVGLLLRRA